MDRQSLVNARTNMKLKNGIEIEVDRKRERKRRLSQVMHWIPAQALFTTVFDSMWTYIL